MRLAKSLMGSPARPVPSLLLSALILCAFVVAGSGQARAEMAGPQAGPACKAGAEPMARLELLFGMSRHHGEPINDQEWQSFVDQEVTPRFPDGMTVVSAYGQWKNQSGQITKENSRLSLIWYQPKPESETLIEAIRAAYKARFQQESVMRVDGLSCVSF